MNKELEAMNEVRTMVYVLWIKRFGLQHSEQLLKAFEFIFEDGSKEFMELVRAAGDLCIMNKLKEEGL